MRDHQSPLDPSLQTDPEPVKEWPRENGFISATKNNFHDALLRGSSDEWVIMMYIAERTRSARHPRPEWVDPDIERCSLLINKSERTVLAILRRLEKRRWIQRRYPSNKTCRGEVKVLPGNIRLAPLHSKHRPRNKPPTDRQRAPDAIAAFRARAVECADYSDTLQDFAESAPVQEASEVIPLRVAADVHKVQAAADYLPCPLSRLQQPRQRRRRK
jgi:hypothetical protein